jgi:serine/threonine protein kinase
MSETLTINVKILDFGLAKLTPPTLAAGASSEVATQNAITDPGTVMGTVGYMSPEQVRGCEADHRSKRGLGIYSQAQPGPRSRE